MSESLLASAPSIIGSFQFLTQNRPTVMSVSDIFAYDLDGDGIQEVIFVGRQTQPATIPDWSNSTVNIFQYQENAWVDVTKRLLPDNVIQGGETVLFGDFNKDGKTDFFIPGTTDGRHTDGSSFLVPSYLFSNNGTRFTKVAYDFQAWAHGASVYDVNKDGWLDLLIADYGPDTGIAFGSSTGFTWKASTGAKDTWGGSAIVAADFLGNGSVTILVGDDPVTGGQAGLYSWSVDGTGKLVFSPISVLPVGRFELPKWASYNFGAGNTDSTGVSHDIRIVPFDFSGDGLLDAIQVTRPGTGGQFAAYTDIQFLLNKGGGVFQDVTDSRLIGFNHATYASYQPVFIDANNDGRTDIFLSGADFSKWNAPTLLLQHANDPFVNSTALLLQQANGTFVEFGRDVFSSLWTSAGASVKSIITGTTVFVDHGQPMQLVKVAGGGIEVFGTVGYTNNTGGLSSMVFSSKLTFSGTQLNETILATNANDTFNGGFGLDTVVFDSSMSNNTVSKTTNGFTIVGPGGTDVVAGIERLKFSDSSLALDISGNAGTTAKILGAVFGRDSVANKEYAGIGLHLLDGGMSYLDLMQLAINAKLGASASNAAVVNLLYTNVVGTPPPAADRDYYVGLLDSGVFTVASLGVLAADTVLNTVNVNLVGLANSGLEYLPQG